MVGCPWSSRAENALTGTLDGSVGSAVWTCPLLSEIMLLGVGWFFSKESKGSRRGVSAKKANLIAPYSSSLMPELEEDDVQTFSRRC